MKTNAQKVWEITDLVKKIGGYKKEFEKASDRKRIKCNKKYQKLIEKIIVYRFDDELIIHSLITDHRLKVTIFKGYELSDLIYFSVYEKYKRKPFFTRCLIVQRNDDKITNEKIIREEIFSNSELFLFFEDNWTVK